MDTALTSTLIVMVAFIAITAIRVNERKRINTGKTSNVLVISEDNSIKELGEITNANRIY